MGSKSVTVVDLGSSKILAITAEMNGDNEIEVKGISEAPSVGIQKGKVIDIKDLSGSIKKALDKLKEKSSVDISTLIVSVSGNFIKYMNAVGKVTLSAEGKSTEIKQEHINLVLEDAKNSVLKQSGLDDYEIIHTIPKYFLIDNNSEYYKLPLMFSGTKLSGEIITILAEKSVLQNLSKCFDINGYHVDTFILSSYASALGVLTEQERDLGCILVDIGSGLSDAIIFSKKYIQAITVNLVGSEEITKDIYQVLRTLPKTANDLKIGLSQLDYSKYDFSKEIEYRTFDRNITKKVKLQVVKEIIERRIQDSLEICYKDLIKSYKSEMISAGLVLTGGACNLETYVDIARETFNMPVKIAQPIMDGIVGKTEILNNLEAATAIGMLRYCALNNIETKTIFPSKISIKNIITEIKKFFSE
jgi:cell division protein FtsA